MIKVVTSSLRVLRIRVSKDVVRVVPIQKETYKKVERRVMVGKPLHHYTASEKEALNDSHMMARSHWGRPGVEYERPVLVLVLDHLSVNVGPFDLVVLIVIAFWVRFHPEPM